MSVDMKGLNALQAQAGAAYVKHQAALKYALSAHAGFVAALKACSAAADAYEAVRVKAEGIIVELASDPATDGTWLNPKWVGGPVWLRDNAITHLQELGAAQDALQADMAAHLSLNHSDVAQNPWSAAAAADKAAQTPHPLHPRSPNAASPDAQDPHHPPVDSPPVPDEGPRWGLWAALLAAAVVAAKVLVR